MPLCSCGISRYGFCLYCGGNLILDIVGFVLLFFLLFSSFKK